MAVSVTNTTISALGTAQTFTANAATSSDLNGTEVFTITPTKAGVKMCMFLYDASTAAIPKPAYSVGAGDLWAGVAQTGTFGSTTAAASIKALEIDTAKAMTDDGTILVTLTPSSSTYSLKDSHHCGMYVLEML